MLKLICTFFAWLFGYSEIISGRGSAPDFHLCSPKSHKSRWRRMRRYNNKRDPDSIDLNLWTRTIGDRDEHVD